jgi:two-component system, NtrC family, sensor kinase
MNLPSIQPSLGRKITFGYLAVAVLTLGVSLFTFEELRWFEARILLGERIGELFDETMELRRFERNFFLHREQGDYLENGRYIVRLRDRLSRSDTDFALLGAQQRISALRGQLDRYGELMERYAKAGEPDQARLEPEIRAAGKEIITVAEDMATSERQLVRSSLTTFRTVLVFSIVGVALLMVVIGQVLSRRVVQPLKALEVNVDAISSGRRDKLALPAEDREIVSIINAFNHMLKELDLRQRHLLHSEKLASLGTMLSGVAHELNNPLSNIWTSNQLLLEELGDTDVESQRQLLLRIDEQGERARSIVKSLLDFSRDAKFRPQQVALRELVDQTLRFIKGEIAANAAVSVDVADDLSVFADRQRLQQALLNLVRNGLEAGKTVSISARGPLPAYNDPDIADGIQVVEISIRDDGPGIAPEILPRIFDPFFTTKDVGKGMGLGLFIVHQIVEEHGGAIAVTSEPGQGTAFRIRLPATGGPDA